MRLVTLHADLRMRVWSVKDGTCVNSSGNLTITDKPVQLLSSTI